MLVAGCWLLTSVAYAIPLSYKLAPGDTLKYLAGNSIVDIEYDTIAGVPTIWVGTEGGASRSTDLGATWQTYTTAQGLNANSVSALDLHGDTVWVGMAHLQDFNGDLFPVGDGFNFSFDGGQTWDTTTPDQSTGKNFFSTQSFGMLPYDIAGEPSGIWSACFFAGLIRTIDGGQNWFNVYPSVEAKNDLDSLHFNVLANRFFAVTAAPLDTNGDTIEVYAGSAGGITRFLVIDAKYKLAGAPVWSITPNNVNGVAWLATGGGVSRVERPSAQNILSYFDSTVSSATLPSDLYRSSATPIYASRDTVVMGAFQIVGSDTVGAGLVRITGNGSSWQVIDSSQFVGVGRGAYDLAYSDYALYAAAGTSGLWRSFNNGTTWEQLYVDTTQKSPDSSFNKVYSVAYDTGASQLYVGTYNGIYRITLGGGDAIAAYEASLYRYSAPDTTRAQFVRRLRVFRSGGNLLLWAATHRLTGSTSQRNTSLFSNDSGVTWQTVHKDLIPWDFALLRDTVYGATNGGLLVVPLAGGNYVGDTVWTVSETLFPMPGDTATPPPLVLEPTFRSIRLISDTLWLGGDHGFAYRRQSIPDWHVEPFVPRDSVDQIRQIAYDSLSDTSISGNFVIALEIQKLDTAKIIWASTRPSATGQTLGLSKSTDEGRSWSVNLKDRITWNIASYKEHVWAATSAGLYHTTDGGISWRKLSIIDAANGTGFYDPTEILSVRQIDDVTVLAGSEDGFAISSDLGQTWTIIRSFVGLNTADAGGTDVDVYASPVPFSPRNGRVRIHYKPTQSGNVSIEVFDFAMQKVATILDGVYRDGRPGPDPSGTNHYVEEWDAHNDKGKLVATGVYFFRVEMNGETKWGKLVILP